MKACGIVVEYNPFHNGHLHHIQKAREITNCDVLIAVMSGTFVQRGEPAIIDKWTRTKTALENGVDIVIELPFVFSNQSAQQFANGSIRLLMLAGVNDIVFGSESNNMEELQEIANLSINTNHLREKLDEGLSYPKAYGLMAGSYYPNDILGISYLKALKGSNITPHTIQRTNHYHDQSLDQEYVSASALRTALKKHNEIEVLTPMYKELTSNPLHFIEDYYPTIRMLLLTISKSYLKELFLFSEGIENHLYKNALMYDKYEVFINHCITKRYTRSRIQRCLMSLLLQLTKEEVANLPKLDTLRILGFNATGQKYLKELKKQEISLATKFNQIPAQYRDIEYRASLVYSIPYQQDLQKREIQEPIII